MINTATIKFKSFTKIAKIDVEKKANDQKAVDSPEATPSTPDTFNDLMKDLDDLLKEDEEGQNGFSRTNNAN